MALPAILTLLGIVERAQAIFGSSAKACSPDEKLLSTASSPVSTQEGDSVLSFCTVDQPGERRDGAAVRLLHDRIALVVGETAAV